MIIESVKFTMIDEIYKQDSICLCGKSKIDLLFKDCCFGKNITIEHYMRQYNLNNNNPLMDQKCIYDDTWVSCSNEPIDSHSISKKKHLVTLAGDDEFLFKINPKRSGLSEMRLEFKKNGPVSSSLFKGCCLLHDSVYNPIDNFFNIYDKYHYLLQAQRQYLYEYYHHKQIYLRLDKLQKNLKISMEYLILEKHRYRTIMDELLLDIKLFKNNLDIDKGLLDIKNKDFSCYCLKFDEKVPFTFSGIMRPYVTMSGETIVTEDYVKNSTYLPSLYAGLLYSETGSFLVFLCRKNDYNIQKFIKNIIDDKTNIMQNLIKMTFMISNSYYNKGFVDSYLEVNKDIVLDVYEEDLLAYNELYNPKGRLKALNKLPLINKQLSFKYNNPK